MAKRTFIDMVADWEAFAAEQEKLPPEKRKTRLAPLATRRQYRDNSVKHMYGITLEQVEAMYTAQQGRCANIGCRKEIPLEGRTRHIDHCHKTGKVRGILCRGCNVALGMLGEDAKRIAGLLDYAGFADLSRYFKKDT